MTEYISSQIAFEVLREAVRRRGYDVEPHRDRREDDAQHVEERGWLRRVVLAWPLVLGVMVVSMLWMDEAARRRALRHGYRVIEYPNPLSPKRCPSRSDGGVQAGAEEHPLRQDRAERQLAGAQDRFEATERAIEQAVDLAEHLGEANRMASEEERRLMNQAMFERIWAKDSQVSGATLTAPAATLLAHD